MGGGGISPLEGSLPDIHHEVTMMLEHTLIYGAARLHEGLEEESKTYWRSDYHFKADIRWQELLNGTDGRKISEKSFNHLRDRINTVSEFQSFRIASIFKTFAAIDKQKAEQQYTGRTEAHKARRFWFSKLMHAAFQARFLGHWNHNLLDEMPERKSVIRQSH